MPIDQFQIDKYSTDEDNLLEYVIKVADVIAPDIVFADSGTPYNVDSLAPSIFKRRYNRRELNVYFHYEDYIKTADDNESVIDIIHALEIDPEKFWYLLLFITTVH